MDSMDLKPLKEIRLEKGCEGRTCSGCDLLGYCDHCECKFCKNYQDERGDWKIINDEQLCPICTAVEENRLRVKIEEN